MTQSEVQTKATAYFTALFTRPEATGLQVTATYTTSGGNQIMVAATANVPTNFMGLIGKSQMQVGVDSQIKWGNSRLRVALVLDNTGSMASNGKMMRNSSLLLGTSQAKPCRSVILPPPRVSSADRARPAARRRPLRRVRRSRR